MNNKKKKDKRVNFEVPEELHTCLKMAAVSSGMSIKMFILGLIIEELRRTGHVKLK